jgi:hypothetical protein
MELSSGSDSGPNCWSFAYSPRRRQPTGGGPPGLEFGKGLTTPDHVSSSLLRNVTQDLGICTLFWTRQWTFGFYIRQEVSWNVERLLASQEGLCSVEWLNWLVIQVDMNHMHILSREYSLYDKWFLRKSTKFHLSFVCLSCSIWRTHPKLTSLDVVGVGRQCEISSKSFQ